MNPRINTYELYVMKLNNKRKKLVMNLAKQKSI